MIREKQDLARLVKTAFVISSSQDGLESRCRHYMDSREHMSREEPIVRDPAAELGRAILFTRPRDLALATTRL